MEITLEMLHKEAARLTGCAESDKAFKGAVCMLAALHVGAKSKAVSEFTNYPIGLVRELSGKLRASGIWTKDGKTRAEWFGKDGGIAFNCDVAVAMGLLRRVAEKKKRSRGDREHD